MASYASATTTSHHSLHFNGLMVVRDVGMPCPPDSFGRDMEEYVRDMTGLNVQLVQNTNLYLREALDHFSVCMCCWSTKHSRSICTDEHSGYGSGSRSRCLGILAASIWQAVFGSHEHFLLVVGLHVPTEATPKCLLPTVPRSPCASVGALRTRWRSSLVTQRVSYRR